MPPMDFNPPNAIPFIGPFASFRGPPALFSPARKPLPLLFESIDTAPFSGVGKLSPPLLILALNAPPPNDSIPFVGLALNGDFFIKGSGPPSSTPDPILPTMLGILFGVSISPPAGTLDVGESASSLFERFDFFMNGNPVPTFVPDDNCMPLSGGGSGNGPLLAFIPPRFPLLNDPKKEFFVGMVLPLSLLAFNAPTFPLLSDSKIDVFVGVAPNFFPLLNDSKNEFFFDGPAMFGVFTSPPENNSPPFNGLSGEEGGKRSESSSSRLSDDSDKGTPLPRTPSGGENDVFSSAPSLASPVDFFSPARKLLPPPLTLFLVSIDEVDSFPFRGVGEPPPMPFFSMEKAPPPPTRAPPMPFAGLVSGENGDFFINGNIPFPTTSSLAIIPMVFFSPERKFPPPPLPPPIIPPFASIDESGSLPFRGIGKPPLAANAPPPMPPPPPPPPLPPNDSMPPLTVRASGDGGDTFVNGDAPPPAPPPTKPPFFLPIIMNIPSIFFVPPTKGGGAFAEVPPPPPPPTPSRPFDATKNALSPLIDPPPLT